ncbi:MAG: SDR family NAD(P)-dependent oxidoreductase [Candidatus Pacebacteria bacterium]|nr:SDR family NAD(P)-dependent oxidoreductase [Candidatus Paceibacterota bacterium]
MWNLRSKNLNQQWWLVLGASSSLGRALAEAVARRGGSIILAGRKLEVLEEQAQYLRQKYPSVIVVVQIFDSSLALSRRSLVRFCQRQVPPGQLNIFLGFAHYAGQIAIEESLELATAVLDTSLTQAALIMLEFIPLLTAKPGGRVIIVSSVSGERGRARNYIYGAAKAGLGVVASGLRARLHPHGVSVLTVKSGLLSKSDQPIKGLRGLLAAAPKQAAEVWINASLSGRNSLYYPWFWRWISMAIWLIPEGLFKRLRF